MDPILYYALREAVDRSLKAAGREGFALSRVGSGERWFETPWLYEYVESFPHEFIPFRWEERELKGLDTLRIGRRQGQSSIRFRARSGIMVVGDETAVAILYLLVANYAETVVLVGERRAGAVQEFVDAYSGFARQRSRNADEVFAYPGDSFPRDRSVSWDDIILTAGMKEDICRQVDAFFANREAYSRLHVPYRRGLLFTGPPGNGKTTLLRIIGAVRPEPLILVASKPGLDQSHLDKAFEKAVDYAPAILCFEDVDSLFKDIPLSYFLNQVDGLKTLEGVLILATTNHPDELDAALTDRPSRFDRIFVIDRPGSAERAAYLRRKFGALFDEHFVRWTDGFSMAQLQEIWVSACLDSIHEGRAAPSHGDVRRAIRRQGRQRETLDQGWEPDRIIGFQHDRFRALRD